jgi:hypothetical protein
MIDVFVRSRHLVEKRGPVFYNSLERLDSGQRTTLVRFRRNDEKRGFSTSYEAIHDCFFGENGKTPSIGFSAIHRRGLGYNYLFLFGAGYLPITPPNGASLNSKAAFIPFSFTILLHASFESEKCPSVSNSPPYCMETVNPI